MTAENQLSIEGTFLEHPFAELVAEIAHTGLDGSLRVSQKEKKGVFYFKKGRIAMAVSNVRSFRLFEMLLERKRFTKDELARIPNISNDFELADVLQNSGLIDKDERTALFVEQIKAILIDTMGWMDGSWTFNALARLRDGLMFDVPAVSLLVDYARCLPPQQVLGRFRTDTETFVRSETAVNSLVPTPHETAVLRITADQPRSVLEIMAASGIPGPSAAAQAIYSLWLGGILVRDNWKPGFPNDVVAKMTGVKLALKQEARLMAPVRTVISRPEEQPAPTPAVSDTKPIPETRISLDEYLAQVESAETYYDVLGVEVEANVASIKKVYFNLAKSFHPDHFHQESSELLARVQSAFTELTRAHETLKDEALRESYNFKVRKELEEKRKGTKASTPDERGRNLAQALENFERGFSLLMENESEAALPFLARAVHFDPNNARFHAYFGKALSTDDTKRHKAESEMQTALRLDPQNTTYRIMLAEFFIQMRLTKRAEGELNRLLAVFPSNREARELLNSIKSRV